MCILELLKLVLPLDSRSTLGSQHSAVIPVMQYIHMPWLYILDKSFVLNILLNLVWANINMKKCQFLFGIIQVFLNFAIFISLIKLLVFLGNFVLINSSLFVFSCYLNINFQSSSYFLNNIFLQEGDIIIGANSKQTQATISNACGQCGLIMIFKKKVKQ